MTSNATLADAAPAAPENWSPRALYTVACLGITAGVQMSDMGLQALSLSSIQQSFGISDSWLGALQGLAGVLVGSAIAIPLARFADRFSRKRVLLCLIAASTAMMVLSALAPSFPLFFLGRSAAGITEFAMIPLVYSMIPDLAPERHRVATNLSFAALMALGASGGFYFGGAIIATADGLFGLPIEPWRKGFLLLSFAGLPLLLLAAFTLDPARRIVSSDPKTTGALTLFLRQRWQAVGLFVGVAGALMVAVQALNQLITLALEREFHAEVARIGQAMGMIVLVTTIGCLPIAWFLDRLLSRRFGRAARPLIMGLSAVAAIPFAFLLLAAPTLEQALMAVAAFMFMTCTANALVPTMLQDLTPATLRARSFAIWSFVVSIFSATGPLLAGTLSDRVTGNHLLNAITLTAIPALAISATCAVRSFLRARAEG
ncbi:MFS transporter [Sandaracinobacter sp. RS1-74]|uniref:MFS transporter n=1 Tax=Sandaracinobacteroides sayramensis TaxID=2913411 RepID=UPI001EDB5083|nr:MFS transporter [Sandaracinobacteroides sayramensis]MCG2842627.1 MFS transporter [Sandaracinobacteroides sayramensis]